MASHVTKNTVTNYVVVFIRLLQGILVTRWSIFYLGTDNYGLWAVLWSFFAYSLLLDFGLGAAAQKYTGTGLYHTDISRYNSVISAVLCFYLVMMLVIATISIGASFFISELFDLSDPAQIAYCRKAFLVFSLGSALIFPTTIFNEIMVGLQKLYLRNYMMIAGKVVELVGTLVVFLCGGQVISLTFLVLGVTLATNLSLVFFIRRNIAGFRFSFRTHLAIYKEIGKFSLFVYLLSISRLLLVRSSRIIITIFYGLAAAGIFHMASRLPELCQLASSQYQENIRPVTARLHAQRKMEELSRFIRQSMRINLAAALFFCMPAYLFTPEALRFLFKIDNPEVFSLSRLFLVSMFLGISIRQILHAYLVMSDWHRMLSYVIMVEAALNLTLNILLIRSCGVAVILINSIVIQMLLSCFVLLPVVMKTLHLRLLQLLKTYALPVLLVSPGVGAALVFRYYFQAALSAFWMVVLGGTICSGSFLVLGYFFLLSAEERSMLWHKIQERLPKSFRKIFAH